MALSAPKPITDNRGHVTGVKWAKGDVEAP